MSKSKEGIASDIDAKVNQLTTELGNLNQYLVQLTSNLKRLRNERKLTLEKIQLYTGALQAYSESSRLLNEGKEVPAANDESVPMENQCQSH